MSNGVVRGLAKARVGIMISVLCGLASAGCAAPNPPATHARTGAEMASTDSNQARAEQLIAALAAGNAEAAEQDFSAHLRAVLPPSALGTTWQSLLGRAGAFKGARVVTHDHAAETDRFTLELECAQSTLLALVVLEPESREVVGLFFNVKNPATDRAAGAGPADPQVEEVALSIGAVQSAALGASLTLPKGRGDQRLPAVLLVQGSGPGDRDETLQGAKPFRDLAYGLARHGVAALRFDKRTFAHPESFDPTRVTVEEEVLADAVAALRVLAARPEVDAHRLFVVGHSLGGLLAPEIAERAGGIAGLVLLAAPGRPVLEVTLEQFRANGASAADLATLEAKVHALPTLPPTEMLFGAPALYFQDLARRDEPAIATRLRLPVLYLRGELDRNVAAVDQANWAHALSGKVPFTEATLPGLNHLFLPASEPLTPASRIPDDVSARVAAFCIRLK